ncbi:hypothetical protein [Nocardioides sp.]|uniref:hypothetical protein n=1 Tax=Nocardioides sp. TaxID=35761 RepID=UPI003784EE1F
MQAQLLGRVLGLRVLRVDGTVLVAPARLEGPAPAVPRPPSVPDRAPAARAGGPPGSGLAEAARLLAASDAVLHRAAGLS